MSAYLKSKFKQLKKLGAGVMSALGIKKKKKKAPSKKKPFTNIGMTIEAKKKHKKQLEDAAK
jgi:hypothetical protein